MMTLKAFAKLPDAKKARELDRLENEINRLIKRRWDIEPEEAGLVCRNCEKLIDTAVAELSCVCGSQRKSGVAA
jgi:hypothetical protein